MNPIDELTHKYRQNEENALKDFFTFLKFQSISSEPEYQPEMKKCADWLVNYLQKLHFETEVWETKGHPVIFASNLKAGKDKPTLLIYNHYDVQPVDPLNLWQTSPFQPEIKNGKVYARGAQDNKGQCFYTLQALKHSLLSDGSFPINIKLCIEGEEECGSHGLSSLLNEKSQTLKADYLAIVDLGIKSLDQPSITLGIRGIVTMDVEVTGAKTDMHSGSNGGLLYNPNHALIEILSSLRDANGHITIPGFYDDIHFLSDEENKLISWDFDEEEYFHLFGAAPTGGEKNYLPLQRNWIRPTLEINGISGGYSGAGFKTVIPSLAIAKISCRLVAGQNPKKILSLVKQFLEENCPKGVSVKVTPHAGGGEALSSSPSSQIVQVFKQSYEEVFQKKCIYCYEGASIPIVTELQKASQAEVVLVGLGLSTDCIHAPNEHFDLNRLEKGFLIIARAIQLLSKRA